MTRPVPRSILITGAGAGIGRATARRFLAEGWEVTLLGRRRETLEETAAGAPARILTADVGDPAQVEAAFAGLPRLDVLFNNAGIAAPAAPIDEIPVDTWLEVSRTNITGMFLCARAAFGLMRRQDPRGGRIINNGSLSAHRPRPRSVAYAVTKHAINGLTASMLLDLREVDICVTQIDIGNAATSMTAGFSTGTLQADGSLATEPTFDAVQVARAVAHLVDLPLEVSIPSLTIMARAMPYFGRG